MPAIENNGDTPTACIDDFSHHAWDHVPEGLRLALKLYIEHGYPPGHFLTAVLNNDLRDSVGRADRGNLPRLGDLVIFLHNYTPSQCSGSPEKVKAWIAKGGLGGKPFSPNNY